MTPSHGGGLRLLQNHTEPLFLSQREGHCTQGTEVALGTGSTMTDTLQSHLQDGAAEGWRTGMIPGCLQSILWLKEGMG